MKFLCSEFKEFKTKFVWKESADNFGESVAEKVENPIFRVSEEYSEDVDSVLQNERPKNFIARMYNKTKNFFKTKILGVTEKNYNEWQNSIENNGIPLEKDKPLKNLSSGQIKAEFLYKTDDVYMFWACLEKLIDEKRDFNWREPKVLATMNRISKTEFFAANDYKELSNELFYDKIKKWILSIPQFGKEKADLWAEDFVAESMKKADGDYKDDAENTLKEPEKFKEIIGEYFENFAQEKDLAAIDKGYVLAFLRLMLKNKKLNENLRKSFLIHGAAIGFISNADIRKMSEDFSVDNLWLQKLEKMSFEDCKKLSAQINEGKIPNTKAEFVKENKNVSDIFDEELKAEKTETVVKNISPENSLEKAKTEELPIAA